MPLNFSSQQTWEEAGASAAKCCCACGGCALVPVGAPRDRSATSDRKIECRGGEDCTAAPPDPPFPAAALWLSASFLALLFFASTSVGAPAPPRIHACATVVRGCPRDPLPHQLAQLPFGADARAHLRPKARALAPLPRLLRSAREARGTHNSKCPPPRAAVAPTR